MSTIKANTLLHSDGSTTTQPSIPALAPAMAFAHCQLINLATTPVIQTSYNISSVTDVGTGKWACNFTTNTAGEKPTFTVSGQNRTNYDEIYYASIDNSDATKMQGGCTRSQASAGWHDTHKLNFIAFESS